jgi:FMN-dependent NADH-azoreductase
MPLLLKLDSSADLGGSRTRQLTDAVARAWSARGPEYEIVSRDLHLAPLPHLRTPAQRGGQDVPAELDELQHTVISELLGADAVVIGAPMYNYAMPSTLKAWIDLVHVPGVTAPFGGSSQPLAGRPVVIATARGAAYDAGTPSEGWDHVVPPLRLVLGEGLGMTVHVVSTERTLADRIPALDAELGAAQLGAALAEASRLGEEI